jgi:hypothetical protein
MEPIELLMPDGEPSKVLMCSNCRIVRRTRAYAEACCLPIPCRYCGEPTEKVWRSDGDETQAYHRGCWDRHWVAKDREKMAAAEVVESWDGWVHSPAVRGHNDGFFESLADLQEYLDDEDDDGETSRPEFAYLCEPEPFPGISAEDICEGVAEDMFEDAEDQFSGTEELEAACEAFNAANAHVVTYRPDYRRVVRVPARPAEAPSPLGL